MTAPVYPLVKPKGRALRAVRRAVLLQVAAGTLLQAPKLIARGDASTAVRHVPVATPPALAGLRALGTEPDPVAALDQSSTVGAGLPDVRAEAAGALDPASAATEAAAQATPFLAGTGGIAGLGALVASGKTAALAGALIAFGAGVTGVGLASGPIRQPAPVLQVGVLQVGVLQDGRAATATVQVASNGLVEAPQSASTGSAAPTETAPLTVPAGFGDGPGGASRALQDTVDVPEPASLLTFALGAAAAIRARRRARAGV